MKHYLQRKVVFFGGKGGVGKTTTSSAFALRAADHGKKTLLVSTDPAHNLRDIFERQVGQEPTQLRENLWALEIDPHHESHRYIASVKENLRKVVSVQMMNEIERQIDIAHVSPGADESALFDRIVEIIQWIETDFDLIVFDTAPTGHTLRLLSLPELMGAWVDSMLSRRQKVMSMRETWLEEAAPAEDPIYEILTARKLKFARAREVILNAKLTAFSFVLTPERLPIAETTRALPVLQKYQVPVDTLVVNRVIPDEADGEFIRRRREQERKYLTEIEQQFSRYRIVRIPMLEQDVAGLEALDTIAGHLF
ncbi:ArsA family ATPase [Brevibacillus humidisoli]|uniref:ArsA family ATPase n=1 Tax=Brevibacillus humidisoli TaxID=2895522 RepID=UPI001E3FCDF3|nr:ArsA family ATPase [Brevibacillus humidisoli]UFJ40249.1 ArsA family ATPase [Brevibacillus humidisoli]